MKIKLSFDEICEALRDKVRAEGFEPTHINISVSGWNKDDVTAEVEVSGPKAKPRDRSARPSNLASQMDPDNHGQR